MRGKLKEDHHTVDGALYSDDIVIIHTIDNISDIYRVETKLGKKFSIPQSKIKILLDK